MHRSGKDLTLASLAAALLLTGCSGMRPMAPELDHGVTYAIEFAPTWTMQSHPVDYPPSGILTGPHFSGLIGASHRAGFELFADGRLPTPGLERLSEEGKHSPLDEEIAQAIEAGDAGTLFESGPIKDLAMRATTTVRVNEQFPLVSLVAMIAPSPDWFAGVANVDLHEGGQWVAQKEVTIWAWDSGGDSGTTYLAADADLSPKQPTHLADAAPFMKDGTRIPVARLTLRRQ